MLQLGKTKTDVFARVFFTVRKGNAGFRMGSSVTQFHNEISGPTQKSSFSKFSVSDRRNPIYTPKYFNSSDSSSGSLDRLTFNNVCSETLDSLSEYFEELIESIPHLKSADVTYSDGVLTVYFGQKHGTYVINRQTPNLQIWLSSPTSGPKRYDFSGGTWVYKHDNTTLHSLLDKEIKDIANQEVEFTEKCLHSKMKI